MGERGGGPEIVQYKIQESSVLRKELRCGAFYEPIRLKTNLRGDYLVLFSNPLGVF